MTVADYIALFSSLAALFTAAATLGLVLEAKRQRLQQISPDLHIISSYYHFQGDDKDRESWRKPHDFQISLEVINVGFGAAKDIKINWNLDMENYLGTIAQSFELISYRKENGTISISSPVGKSTHFISNQMQLRIPLLQAGAMQTIIIPFIINEIFLIYLWSIRHAEKNQHVPDFPILTLHLEYRNLSKQLSKKDFEIKLTPGMFAASLREIGVGIEANEA